jgi:hypothetical protein
MVAGNYIMGAVVVIVNVKLLINSYEYTWWYITMFLVSLGLWPVTYWALSVWVNYPLYGVFQHSYNEFLEWLVLFFLVSAFILIDAG